MTGAAFSARSAAGALWRLAKDEPAAFRRLAVRAGLDTGLCALMTAFGSLEPDSVPMALNVVIVILGAIATIDLFVVLPLRVSALVIGPDAVKALNFRTIAAMAIRGFKVFSTASFAAALLLWPALIALWLFGGQQDGLNSIIEGSVPLWLAAAPMLLYSWVAVRLFPIVPMRLIDETVSLGRVWTATQAIRFRIMLAWMPFFAGSILSAVPLLAVAPTPDPDWANSIASVLVVLMLSVATLTGAATNAAIACHVRERLRENGPA